MFSRIMCAALPGLALPLTPFATATAADLPTKAPPRAPAFSWSDCYVGVNGGGAASGSNFKTAVDNGTHLIPNDAATVGAFGTGSGNDSNFIAGGQIGCNWQSETVVYGFEADADYFRSNARFTNGTGTLSTGDGFAVTQSLTTDYLATLRPRLGVAADRSLFYATGGAAFTRVRYLETYADTLNAGFGSATGSQSLIGWTAGGGCEYAWSDHFVTRIEYLFAGFPKVTNAVGRITDTAGGTNVLHGSADLIIQTVRVGLNYKFRWPQAQ
jgi:outer membrane immunogenic protein